MGTRRRSYAAIGVIAAVASISAYGSAYGSSAQPSAHTAKASSNAKKAAINSAIAGYHSLFGSQPKQPFKVQPLAKPAPAHKVLGIISCTLPVCASYTQGTQQAAKYVGWKTITLTPQLSPQSFQSTWNTLLQSKPNAIMFDAGLFPLDTITAQLKQAKADGIAVVGYAAEAQPGSAIDFAVDGPAEFAEQGEAQADTAVDAAHGAPDVVILTDPTVPAWAPMRAKIKQIISATGGSVGELDVSTTNIGQSVPQSLVTYLQSHPKVKYVLPSFDDFLPGVPEALKAAGLNGVKIIGATVSTSSQGLIENGQEYASVVHMTTVKGWWLVYAAARILAGNPPSDRNPAGPQAILTKANAAHAGNVNNWPSGAIAMFEQALRGK
jgi:ribose transport system substrate-binding protein